jgi:uncharacterized membrane protein YbaN (DUF454 family)
MQNDAPEVDNSESSVEQTRLGSLAAPARYRRLGLTGLGLGLTLLGTVGAFLPVLPTTPFLLLAAACFVRSSPRLYGRLVSNRVFGPYLSEWERTRTIPREAKRKAYGLVVVSFAASIWMLEVDWARITLAVIGVALLALLAWLPTTPLPPSLDSEP